jgi:putative ABC transport system permease protein
LLIICSNVAGLLMAKATARQAEIAVRAALGAGRLRLIRQLFMESIPLALLGGGVGFLLALWGLAALRSTLPTSIYRIETASFDAWVFLFTLGVSLLTGLLFNLAPAWSAARANLVEALKTGQGAMAGGARRRYRNVLLVAQLAMTLVLANAAALMLQSYLELSHGDYGFDTERVLTLGLNIQGPEYDEQSALIVFFDDVFERVGSLAGVRHVAATSKLPLEGGTRSTLEETEGHAFAGVDKPSPEVSFVSADYFRAMEVPLIAGRTFGSQDRGPHDSDEVPLPAIINQTMAARLWADESALGKRFSIEPPYQWTVVGVVGDVHQWGPERTPIMEIYFPLSVMPEGMDFFTKSVRYLVVQAELDPLALTSAIRHEITGIDARQPISDIRTTSAIVHESLTARRFNTLLIAVFAMVALVLVAAGIYGVMSFSVAQRSFEIGIRIAMGATRSGVQRMVLAQALRLVTIGVAVGWMGVFATTRLTESMVYGLSATDPRTLVAGTLFFVALGLLGALVPARRATRQDPVLVLRGE